MAETVIAEARDQAGPRHALQRDLLGRPVGELVPARAILARHPRLNVTHHRDE